MNFETEQNAPELMLSPLQKERLEYRPTVPSELDNLNSLAFEEEGPASCIASLATAFPHLTQQKTLSIIRKEEQCGPLTVGVVLSGGQAAGGHNVLSGVFDALYELHPESKLIGFLNGPGGIVRNKSVEITKELLADYRNQGGFDLIGSGRTKIETKEQFRAVQTATEDHALDGLVVVGGDDSNTNAAFLAEFFATVGSKTCVVGVPKTIDGDLQNERIEISFGFDSACKTYSESIGNIARDCLSAKKYYYFIKLMGRSASHITLECALQTQPNLALIAEEVQKKRMKLPDVVQLLVDLVKERSRHGRDYGVVLIPEGIVEFMPDFSALIVELNRLLAHGSQHSVLLEKTLEPAEKISYILLRLTDESKAVYKSLPAEIQLQLLIDRDPHGNVQVSKIDSERLLMQLTQGQLKQTDPSIKFACQPIFCGYEGRSCLPSNFDATYCYSLGRIAALLIARKKSGFIASLKGLSDTPSNWKPLVTPLVSMLTIEEREGKLKTVIQKALVDLDGKAFGEYKSKRSSWRLKDQYRQPGPIQFFGPSDVTDSVPISLRLNRSVHYK